mgnify:CR=1 FL=1
MAINLKNDKYDRFVGYGKHNLTDKSVENYGKKVLKSCNGDLYAAEQRVSKMIGKTPQKEKRQFMNCVCDWFVNLFDSD